MLNCLWDITTFTAYTWRASHSRLLFSGLVTLISMTIMSSVQSSPVILSSTDCPKKFFSLHAGIWVTLIDHARFLTVYEYILAVAHRHAIYFFRSTIFRLQIFFEQLNDFQGHWRWPLNRPYTISCWCFFVTMSLSCADSDLLQLW